LSLRPENPGGVGARRPPCGHEHRGRGVRDGGTDGRGGSQCPDRARLGWFFNRTYRREVLDACLFSSLADVRAETEAWLATYDTERPHDRLGDLCRRSPSCPGPPPPPSPVISCPRSPGRRQGANVSAKSATSAS
jgi:transposase InsO family protein